MNQYLTFFLAGEEYAITILKVTEILECAVLTKVPGAPAWVRGVINLRGAVVPVVDLGVKFGIGQTEITRRTCVVVVEVQHDADRLVLGVMADAVHQVVELGPDQIQPIVRSGRVISRPRAARCRARTQSIAAEAYGFIAGLACQRACASDITHAPELP